MKRTPLARKKCAICREPFEQRNSLHKVCSPDCAIKLAERDAEKKAKAKQKATRAWVRAEKARLKSRGDHLKEAQEAFNAYIRKRDQRQPCISCGNYPDDSGLITGSRVDAGHYRSVGACPELRFEELNCHAQCVKCNQHLSGNTVAYRINLIGRIGQAGVDWLEAKHEPKKYTIDDLKAIKAKYRAMTRELERERKAA